MNRAIALGLVAALNCTLAHAQTAAQSESLLDRLKRMTPPDLGISMPDISVSIPDIGIPGIGTVTEPIVKLGDDLAKTLPVLEELGFEVILFRVHWGLPPVAKLLLRSRGGGDANKLDAIAAKAPSGLVISAIVNSAVVAKRMQYSMKFGTVILDADLSTRPSIKMSFRKSGDAVPVERELEAFYAVCNQTFN